MHIAQAQGNHNPLSATYSDIASTSSPQFPGLSSHRFPENHGDPRGHYQSAKDFTQCFEGRDSPNSIRKNICLHTENTSPGRSGLDFDHDSMWIRLNSLDAVRSFRFVPSYHKNHNVQYGLHNRVQIRYIDSKGKARTATIDFKDLPHMFIGYADKIWNCPVLLCLPELYNNEKKFTYLTDEAAAQVVDRFLECARPYLPNSQEQYMPDTSTTAEAIAGAGKSATSTFKSSPSYTLASESLKEIWIEFSKRAETDTTIRIFKNSFLVANAKGFKTDYRKDSLVGTIEHFQADLERAFDLGLCDPQDSMIDIGHDFCPLKDKGRFTFLWRTCCLEMQVKTLQDLFCNGNPGQTTVYHPGFLSESGTLTFEPPVKSLLRQHGCFYMQCYNSVYLLYSALKNLPYDDDDLVDLACDRKVYNAMALGSRVSHQKSYQNLMSIFGTDGTELLKMIEGGRGKSMSTRMEFRVSLTLWSEIKRIALAEKRREQREGKDALFSSLSFGYPSSVWSIPTPTYVDFLLGNFQKFVSAFHISQVTAKDYVSFERSRVLVCFLLCLKAFPTGQADRVRLLWWDTRGSEGDMARGLGFETTMKDCSFAWFSSIIDWADFVFYPAVSPEIVVPTRIRGWYNEANKGVQGTQQAIDMCEEFLKEYTTTTAHRHLLHLMVHLCLRQYRRDCLEALKKDIQSPFLQMNLEPDDVSFTYRGLQPLFGSEFHWHSGNRSICPVPEKLFGWLWGKTGDLKRTNFETRSFRIFAAHCSDILRDYPQLSSQWTPLLRQSFFECHRVVPFPDTNGSLISTIKRKRSWYSILVVRGAWRWGRKNWDEIDEIYYPDILTMSRPELAELLE